jgi:hypothetical protein
MSTAFMCHFSLGIISPCKLLCLIYITILYMLLMLHTVHKAELCINSVTLQVRDYRRCSSEKGAGIVSVESSPTVNKVCLKMSLENIVKDIPSITDKSWTYGDLMVSIITSQE